MNARSPDAHSLASPAHCNLGSAINFAGAGTEGISVLSHKGNSARRMAGDSTATAVIVGRFSRLLWRDDQSRLVWLDEFGLKHDVSFTDRTIVTS